MISTFKLKTLTLNNFATFTHQEINFSNGFNIIVGETGSGKSLIFDAMELIFGARSDKNLIRKGTEFSSVEAIFECSDQSIKSFFDENGYPFDSNEIILKRIIYKNGKTKSFINYQSTNVKTLHKFARRYIDLVGQFENQKLLNSKYILKLLDNFSGHNSLINDYASTFQNLSETKNKISNLKSQEANKLQRLDYIDFQLSELNSLEPEINDFNTLQMKKEKIKNIELVKNLNNKIGQYFNYNNSSSLVSQFSDLITLVTKNSNQLSLLDIDSLYNAQDSISVFEQSLSHLDTSDLSEEEIDFIVNRLDQYQRLINKFSTDIEGLISKREELVQEKDQLENFNISLLDLESRLNELTLYSFDLANLIHEKRVKSSKKLEELLTKEIQQLNMKGASVEFHLEKEDELTSSGVTNLKMMAQTNPGEGFFEVSKIASGGELSRVLLSMRKVLSSRDSISIFLFDEIDTGIGGETALKIGKNLKDVSTSSQVIAITHLPQIASFADQIINVEKKNIDIEDKVRTISKVKIVEDSDKENFLAEMAPTNL